MCKPMTTRTHISRVVANRLEECSADIGRTLRSINIMAVLDRMLAFLGDFAVKSRRRQTGPDNSATRETAHAGKLSANHQCDGSG
jgi:hypothetical protein